MSLDSRPRTSRGNRDEQQQQTEAVSQESCMLQYTQLCVAVPAEGASRFGRAARRILPVSDGPITVSCTSEINDLFLSTE